AAGRQPQLARHDGEAEDDQGRTEEPPDETPHGRRVHGRGPPARSSQVGAVPGAGGRRPSATPRALPVRPARHVGSARVAPAAAPGLPCPTVAAAPPRHTRRTDRKSTRLNSSHVKISY